MHWQFIEGNWQQIQSKLRSRWDKLTDEDVEAIAGRREHLLGRLRELYSLTAERAEAELRDWERHQEPIRATGPTDPI